MCVRVCPRPLFALVSSIRAYMDGLLFFAATSFYFAFQFCACTTRTSTNATAATTMNIVTTISGCLHRKTPKFPCWHLICYTPEHVLIRISILVGRRGVSQVNPVGESRLKTRAPCTQMLPTTRTSEGAPVPAAPAATAMEADTKAHRLRLRSLVGLAVMAFTFESAQGLLRHGMRDLAQAMTAQSA